MQGRVRWYNMAQALRAEPEEGEGRQTVRVTFGNHEVGFHREEGDRVRAWLEGGEWTGEPEPAGARPKATVRNI